MCGWVMIVEGVSSAEAVAGGRRGSRWWCQVTLNGLRPEYAPVRVMRTRVGWFEWAIYRRAYTLRCLISEICLK